MAHSAFYRATHVHHIVSTVIEIMSDTLVDQLNMNTGV